MAGKKSIQGPATVSFTHPPDKSSAFKFSTYEQLKKFYKNRQVPGGHSGLRMSYVINVNVRYIYVRCRYCNQVNSRRFTISYEKYYDQNDNVKGYMLKKFTNVHVHFEVIRESKHIMQAISKAPADTPVPILHQLLMDKYGLDRKKFYYYLRKVKDKMWTIHALDKMLEGDGYQTWGYKKPIKEDDEEFIHIPQEIPLFYMFCGPKMLEAYAHYGDCCHFNVYQGMMVEGYESYQLALFAGLDYRNRLLPFAAMILRKSYFTLSECVYYCVRKFIIGTKQKPGAIVAKGDESYQSAFERLRAEGIYDGQYIWDPHYELDKVRQFLTDQGDIQKFIALISARTKLQYDTKMQQCYSLPRLSQFLLYAHKFCLSQIESRYFLGFFYQYSASKMMDHILRKALMGKNHEERTIQKKVVPAVTKVKYQLEKIFKKLSLFCFCDHVKYEELLDTPQLRVVRNSIHKDIMDVFIGQYGGTLFVQLLQTEQDREILLNEREVHTVIDKRQNMQLQISLVSLYEGNKFLRTVWQCQCGYSIKCGLPCCHEIKICLMVGASIMQQVNPRWVFHLITQKDHMGKGRPRKTRRNTMK